MEFWNGNVIFGSRKGKRIYSFCQVVCLVGVCMLSIRGDTIGFWTIDAHHANRRIPFFLFGTQKNLISSVEEPEKEKENSVWVDGRACTVHYYL